MVEKIEDLNLPNTVISRIIKHALPDGVSVSKEARAAIGKAASVFIIYISSSAMTEAKRMKHRSLLPQNVLDALREVELESFIEPLQKSLETFQQTAKNKKDKKKVTDNIGTNPAADVSDEVISIRSESDAVASLHSDEVISVKDDESSRDQEE